RVSLTSRDADAPDGAAEGDLLEFVAELNRQAQEPFDQSAAIRQYKVDIAAHEAQFDKGLRLVSDLLGGPPLIMPTDAFEPTTDTDAIEFGYSEPLPLSALGITITSPLASVLTVVGEAGSVVIDEMDADNPDCAEPLKAPLESGQCLTYKGVTYWAWAGNSGILDTYTETADLRVGNAVRFTFQTFGDVDPIAIVDMYARLGPGGNTPDIFKEARKEIRDLVAAANGQTTPENLPAVVNSIIDGLDMDRLATLDLVAHPIQPDECQAH
ncbi:MAG: hypothetical protein ABI459_04375, partial [Deltaproteobacteria bacterium]